MIDRREGATERITLVIDRSLPMPATAPADVVALCTRKGEIVDVLASRLGARVGTVLAYSEIAYHWPPDAEDVCLHSSGHYELIGAEPLESFDFIYGANLAHALELARQACTDSGSRRILVIAYNEPSAHNETSRGQTFFCYPPVAETRRAVEEQVARCQAENIRIDVVLLCGHADNAAAEMAKLGTTLGDLIGTPVLAVPSHEATRDAAERILHTLHLE